MALAHFFLSESLRMIRKRDLKVAYTRASNKAIATIC
jgi:hypothetical protein